MSTHTTLSRITYLIERCLQNEATDQERSELFCYISQDQYKFLIDELFYQSFFKDIPFVDFENDQQNAVFESIIAVDKSNTSSIKFSYWKWSSVAAVFVLVCGLLFYFLGVEDREKLQETYVKRQDREEDPAPKENNNTSPYPLVAKDEALFTTSDGRAIRLDDLSIGEKKTINGITIQKTNLGEIAFVYSSFQKDGELPNKMNTIITPRGSKYKITLPDATVVDLNASSKLVFPTLFSSKERKVSLEGEAYFDVSHDKTKRFVVQVLSKWTKQQVVVYGTAFNINAYPEVDNIVTTLIEGSVKVTTADQEIFLQPLQQSVLTPHSLQVTPANLDVNLAWKNNLFYFVDEPLENVMSQISRWYDVEIVYEANVPPIKLWGQISRDKALDEILFIIEQTNDVQFRLEGKEVHVRQ